MATKAEKLAEIAGNVSSVVGGDTSPIEELPNLNTYDIVCLVTIDEEGTFNKVTQRLYVEKEGTPEEVAYLGGKTRKNFIADTSESEAVLKERFFLGQLKALETAVGGQVKIDISQMDSLGIQYLVFEAPGEDIKKVTTTLDGETLVREVA